MPIYAIIYTDKGKADNPQTAERVFKMTISNYYVREYLHLYREYRKVINIFDAFLLYGKIEYTLDMLKGSINRMCVTDDMNELRHCLMCSMCMLSELYVVEREKLKERISQNDF